MFKVKFAFLHRGARGVLSIGDYYFFICKYKG